jgi:hypothetical protein
MSAFRHHMSQVPKSNGAILLAVGLFMSWIFLHYGLPLIRGHKVRGGPAGKMVATCIGFVLIPLGIVILIFGR